MGISTPTNLPPGANVRLSMVPPHHLVLVAPPGIEAKPEMLVRAGDAGLFTFDDGLTWPHRPGCGFANAYLTAAHPTAFQFSSLADAITCRTCLIAGDRQVTGDRAGRRPARLVKSGRGGTMPATSRSVIVQSSAALAHRLDLLACCELQHGHVNQAERLSHQAARMDWATQCDRAISA